MSFSHPSHSPARPPTAAIVAVGFPPGNLREKWQSSDADMSSTWNLGRQRCPPRTKTAARANIIKQISDV